MRVSILMTRKKEIPTDDTTVHGLRVTKEEVAEYTINENDGFRFDSIVVAQKTGPDKEVWHRTGET